MSRSRTRAVARCVAIPATVLVAALVLAAAGCLVWLSRALPPGMLDIGPPTVTLEDRFGRELRTTRTLDGSRGGWVALDRMDADLIAAFLAAEDHRFHRHSGVDLRALARAGWANLKSGRIVSGGSTITMQLARMLRPSPRTLSGKSRQMLWALRLERHLTKPAILEQYLNRVPLGQGAVGVQAASALYFGAAASDLSLGQAALLAGLARAPSGNNPLVSSSRARLRRAQALERLVRLGFATAAAAERAAAEPLLQRQRAAPFLAPHFTTRILSWAERQGMRPAGAWRTSLDLSLQTELEREVRHAVETLADRGARHAAAVVLDNRSGEVLAWVGSPDFWADTAGQVDMVVSARQPGSALKPFLYALAFDRGATPASVLPDVARVYQTGTGPYRPRNYDRRFHGPVRAREALGSSYNVPAVELASRLGVGSLLHVLRGAGFASLGRSADHYGLGLALGNGDITLLELANGYRGLVNLGLWRPYAWNGGATPTPPAPGRRFATELSAALVLDILADPVARIPGFGIESALDFPFPVAAKTGTSRHFTDNWAVGATGGFTVAVWVGNFSGRPMEGVSGVSGAGPLLHRAVLATARRYPAGALPGPGALGAVAAPICRLSGATPHASCPTSTEWFAAGHVPRDTCAWHDRTGVVALPVEYAEWAERSEQPRPLAPGAIRTSPAAPDSSQRFHIVSPRDRDVYRLPPGVEARYATVALRAVGGRPGAAVRWIVDGVPHRDRRWTLQPGRHRVRAVTAAGDSAEVTVSVE
ncbi:MAG TPA: penicillin-binding protein 1C [Gemmatimonadales bacterium]|nr:penicillin-binding protein 1C [Gemmatimonadales bacterium]